MYGDWVPTCSYECIAGMFYTCRCVTCKWRPEVHFRCFALSLSTLSFKTGSLTELEVYLSAKTRWPVDHLSPTPRSKITGTQPHPVLYREQALQFKSTRLVHLVFYELSYLHLPSPWNIFLTKLFTSSHCKHIQKASPR